MKKAIPFGKYDLLERINVGGMAEVFRAKTYGVEGFERLVAVKRILPNIAEDQEFATMFKDEAKIANELHHANIAQIYELGVVDGSLFIALEHIHGRDLRLIFERCRGIGAAMPVAQACFVVMKLCEGLDYAHNKRDAHGRDMNLVHRDVSPQNVIVSFEGEIKIIDFGIAKAAGKVGKTQAGILKGKFGYMSPEQVRGLPIDRRSDIFATGIVLYELLTNERLFVGESDFSTLEKVRNVEILPPSTYNRKIPDELERIVLKALARDMDDRYSNAIDLHDELQAFVYTAGEFYSRKELASWMKRTFAKEIEEEAAKIEGYRQLAPSRVDLDTVQGRPSAAAQSQRPIVSPAPARPSANVPTPRASQQKVTQGIRRATISMPAAVPPPTPRANGRLVPRQPPREAPPPTPPPEAPQLQDAPPTLVDAERPGRGDLEWDDEELETQIYDSAGAPIAAKEPARPHAKEPRPSAQISSSGVRRQAAATPAFVEAPTVPSENLGEPVPSFAPVPAPPRQERSNRERRPRPAANGSVPPAREPSMTARGTIVPEIHVRRPPSPQKIWLAAALGAVVVAVLVIGGYWVLSPTPTQSATATVARQQPEPPPAAPLPVDPSSGFDITTEPPGGKVRLDGNEIGNAPLRVRSLLAGKHTLEIGGLAGYAAVKQEIVVEQGKAAAIAIKLEKAGAAGGPSATAPPATSGGPTVVKLTSEPVGARVTLVVDGARTVLGVTPTEAKVDATRRAEVVFELDGHAPVTKSIAAGEGAVAAVLVPASAAPPPAAAVTPPKEINAPVAAKPRPPRVERPREEHRRPPREVVTRPPREREREPLPEPRETSAITPRETAPGPKVVDVVTGSGKLTVGAKPPCTVIVDGRDTGRTTPLRDLELPAGPVQITLVNTEFGIRESFSVNVKPGETTKVIKDYSDRLPK